MSSISTTISSLAATNPVVGNAGAYASKQSQLLSTLSGGPSASVSLQNLLTSVNTQSVGNITALPSATDSTSASTDTTSATDAATTGASAAGAPDFSGNSALMIADSQSLQSSQLLSSLTGAGGTFSGVA